MAKYEARKTIRLSQAALIQIEVIAEKEKLAASTLIRIIVEDWLRKRGLL